MWRFLLLVAGLTVMIGVLLLGGCGYESKDNELVGQVKKVVHQTPIICPDYVKADISLGILRNGVGSMSTQDVWVTIGEGADSHLLEEAARTGKLVKVNYSVKRVTFCVPDHIVTRVETIEAGASAQAATGNGGTP